MDQNNSFVPPDTTPANPNDTLEELLQVQRKSLRHAKTRTAAAVIAAIALVLGLVFLLFTLRALSTELLPVLHSATDALDAATDTFRNLAKIDPEAFNTMAAKLGSETDGLSGALENIGKLDPEAINNLLNRLEDVMDVMNRLTGVLETFSGWFGN